MGVLHWVANRCAELETSDDCRVIARGGEHDEAGIQVVMNQSTRVQVFKSPLEAFQAQLQVCQGSFRRVEQAFPAMTRVYPVR